MKFWTKMIFTNCHKISLKRINDYKKSLLLFEQITFLAKSGLTLYEIEQFLGISLDQFNQNYFSKHFKLYTNLYGHLNNVELISYITFNEKLKISIKSNLFKKIFYPLFLIGFAFMTLLVFKYSVMPIFLTFSADHLSIFINFFYYLSLVFFTLLILLIALIYYLFKKPSYMLMIYYHINQFRIFKIIEMYYICLLSHLLVAFDNQGLSTYQTFELINKFKGNTIIANLAYFVSVDLAQGSGIKDSIDNMHIDQNFKNVLLLGITSNKYNKILSQYNAKVNQDIENEIKFFSKVLLIIAYLYIGMIVLLLYQVLTIPLNLINQL